MMWSWLIIFKMLICGYFWSIYSIPGGKTAVFDHTPTERIIIEISFWLMTQSIIPYKMWREYHPKLTNCLIQDAHLDILDWFFRGKNSLFYPKSKRKCDLCQDSYSRTCLLDICENPCHYKKQEKLLFQKIRIHYLVGLFVALSHSLLLWRYMYNTPLWAYLYIYACMWVPLFQKLCIQLRINLLDFSYP